MSHSPSVKNIIKHNKSQLVKSGSHPSNLLTKNTMTNYTPCTNRGNNISRDSWELSYFEHLLYVHNMFLNTIKEINMELFENLQTPDFFDHFSQYIFDNSSKYISPYLEELTDDTEQIYTRYKTYKTKNGL